MPVRRVTLRIAVAIALALNACTPGAPIDDADPDGTLTTNAGLFEPGTIDPQRAHLVTEIAQVLMVFESLLAFDPKALRPIPAAAKELPSVSADGLTYRFTLRDDLKYSDGTPVTARDFAYGFARVCDPVLRAFYAPIAYVVVGCAEWNQLEAAKAPLDQQRAAKQRLTTAGVRATSDKEIVFTLTEPASYFPSVVATWIGSPVRETDVIRGGEQWTEPATYIGNGRYTLSVWKRNERMVFVPNRYHRSPPKIKTWTKLMIGEPAVALAAYRHDEIDSLTLGVGGGDVLTAIESDPVLRTQLVNLGSACTNYMSFNTRRPPFDDVNVRLAFAKALDREAYVRDVLGGQGAAAGTFIPRGLPGHDADDSAQRFDPAEARRLLASSRYAAGIPAIVLNYQPNLTFAVARAKWLRDQWKTHLGVELTLAAGDTQGSIQQLFRRIETIPQVSPEGWCADYPDQQNWLTLLFHSDRAASGGTSRTTGFVDADFDRLVREADRERDPASRDTLYRQASRILSGRAPIAYLNYGVTKTLRKPWVKGVVDSVLDVEIGATSRFEGIYISKRKR